MTRALLGVIATVLLLLFLREAGPALIPVVFALFMAALFRPVERFFSGKLPRAASLILTMLSFLTVIVGAVTVLYFATRQMATEGSQTLSKVETQLDALTANLQNSGLPVPDLYSSLEERLSGFVSSAAASLYSGIVTAVVIFITLALMLWEAPRWTRKVLSALGPAVGGQVLDSARTVERKVGQYLIARTFVSLLAATISFAWLSYVGVEYALAWAVVIFLFNYIEIVGSVLSTVPIIAFALAQGGVDLALWALGGLLVENIIIGDFVDPLVQSKRVKLSPVVVIAAISFWGWAWGILGAIMAVPITATLAIVCAHVESLRPLAMLLGTTPDWDKLDEHTSSQVYLA